MSIDNRKVAVPIKLIPTLLDPNSFHMSDCTRIHLNITITVNKNLDVSTLGDRIAHNLFERIQITVPISENKTSEVEVPPQTSPVVEQETFSIFSYIRSFFTSRQPKCLNEGTIFSPVENNLTGKREKIWEIDSVSLDCIMNFMDESKLKMYKKLINGSVNLHQKERPFTRRGQTLPVTKDESKKELNLCLILPLRIKYPTGKNVSSKNNLCFDKYECYYMRDASLEQSQLHCVLRDDLHLFGIENVKIDAFGDYYVSGYCEPPSDKLIIERYVTLPKQNMRPDYNNNPNCDININDLVKAFMYVTTKKNKISTFSNEYENIIDFSTLQYEATSRFRLPSQDTLYLEPFYHTNRIPDDPVHLYSFVQGNIFAPVGVELDTIPEGTNFSKLGSVWLNFDLCNDDDYSSQEYVYHCIGVVKTVYTVDHGQIVLSDDP